MAIHVNKFGGVALMMLLVSCGGSSPSNEADFQAYRKSPQVCSAESYFEELSRSQKLHYVFGALHVRPQAACIVDLIAAQDFDFLLLLQKEIIDRGGIFDRYAFIDAVMLKQDRGDISESELEQLALGSFCIEIDASSNRCSRVKK